MKPFLRPPTETLPWWVCYVLGGCAVARRTPRAAYEDWAALLRRERKAGTALRKQRRAEELARSGHRLGGRR